MYEALEEDHREPVEEMFLAVQENENDTIVVEYDWIEETENVAPEEHFILDSSKVKHEKRRLNRSEDDSVKIIQLQNNQKLYQCEICMKTFKERSKLKSHKEIHTDQRNVICPQCGKAFKTQACLRSHRRVHNPTYMYCDMCGKTYTQKPELTKHIKFVHFQIRDHYCETCGASFGSKGHLSTHMLTHQYQVVKPNICNFCTLSFQTKAKLDRHMKSHTGERNYECGICNKRFLYSYNVTAHIKHVHEKQKRKESDRNCQFCGKVS